MDQLKEILRQAIKYRFWIAVGISALLPIVAYIVGSGPVQAKTATETAKIEGAKKKVEVYANGVVPNRQWPPLVAENTEVLSKDVRAAWKKLYARQAPLLTWPELVQERFLTWGRKWPETEDSSRVQVAIIEYVPEYKNYVESVYQSFHPFDTETGKGIVAAPPRDALLRPAQFDENQPPDLGKVWAAQERLWLQRTMLEVIADVNKNAKDWNTAIVRQINSLEVGSPAAQDQKSLAKGDTLEGAPAITDPKAPPPPEPEQTQTTMPGMSGMGMGLGKEKPDAVFYLKKAEGTQSDQYKTLPVQMSVLVDQDHIPDFLVALENSPMSVQVMDFDMGKPTARVVRPEKGVDMSFAGYGSMGMMGMMGSRMMGPSLSGYGGSNAMQQMMARMTEMGNMRGGPMMGGGSTTGGTSKRSGVDKRSVDARKKREQEKEKEAAQKPKTKSIHDPYYNIVEVTVYGQARFYNPPPPEPVAEPSQAPSETVAVPVEGAEKGETEKAKGETEKAMPEAEKAKDETEKTKDETEKTKDEAEKTKGEPAKAEDEKAKSDDAPKDKDDADKDEPDKATPKK